MKSIARNQGHFEPANNYQRYIVLHSGTIGTIEYQENSIWRQSRLDLQRSVFRTMTYTIWALQIFYLMKRKRKEDLQVNLWDFSRQSDDLMSEFWFAFNKLLNLHLTPRIFFSEKDLRTNLFPSKNISVARVWPFQSQFLTWRLVTYLTWKIRDILPHREVFCCEEMTILQDILTLRTQ